MIDGTELPPKHQVAEELLNEGAVFIHFDPRVEGVVAPLYLKDQPQLVFQFGYGLAVPIPDLFIDEEGISGTLSFQRTPHACFVPWSAAFAIVGEDGRGLIFPESMPPEIRAEVDREASRRARLSVPPEQYSEDYADDGGLLGENFPAGEEPDAAGSAKNSEDGARDNVIHVAFGRQTPPDSEPPTPPAPPNGSSPPSLKRIK